MVKAVIDDSTQARILAAAKKVFLLKGMDGARMQDIADEAGINKALLHYYFRSKDKLFETIFLELSGQFLPRVAKILEEDSTIFDKIRRFCNEYISQIIQTPYVPNFVMNEMNKQPKAFLTRTIAKRNMPFAAFIAQLDKEIREGIIKPIHPVTLLVNTLSLCLFPFIARPMIQLVGGLNTEQFNQMMELRKTEVANMIIDSIKT